MIEGLVADATSAEEGRCPRVPELTNASLHDTSAQPPRLRQKGVNTVAVKR
jgi:hypothetical protein